MSAKADPHIKYAAIWFKGELFLGLSHADCYCEAADHYDLSCEDIFATAIEGFFTSDGSFVDRETAYQIALQASQCDLIDEYENRTWLDYADVESDLRYCQTL